MEYSEGGPPAGHRFLLCSVPAAHATPGYAAGLWSFIGIVPFLFAAQCLRLRLICIRRLQTSLSSLVSPSDPLFAFFYIIAQKNAKSGKSGRFFNIFLSFLYILDAKKGKK